MNIKSENLQNHLAHLRGDVSDNTYITIDNVLLKTTQAFNIYLYAEEFSKQLADNGKTMANLGLEDLNFTSWLELLGVVMPAIVKPASVKEPTNYLVTPISPTFRNVVKIVLIISEAVGDAKLLEITKRDVYIYSIFKDVVRTVPYNPDLTALENIKKLSSEGEDALQQVLWSWRASKNPVLTGKGIPKLEEILCFNMIPASRVPSFKDLC